MIPYLMSSRRTSSSTAIVPWACLRGPRSAAFCWQPLLGRLLNSYNPHRGSHVFLSNTEQEDSVLSGWHTACMPVVDRFGAVWQLCVAVSA